MLVLIPTGIQGPEMVSAPGAMLADKDCESQDPHQPRKHAPEAATGIRTAPVGGVRHVVPRHGIPPRRVGQMRIPGNFSSEAGIVAEGHNRTIPLDDRADLKRTRRLYSQTQFARGRCWISDATGNSEQSSNPKHHSPRLNRLSLSDRRQEPVG